MDQARRTIVPADPNADHHGRWDDTDDLRHWLVQAMMWTAVVLIMTVRVLAARQNSLPWSAVFAAMLPYPPLVVLLTNPRRVDVRIVLLIALVALYALPFAFCGLQWQWIPWPLAVASLCVFRGRVGWPLFGLVLLGNLVGCLKSGRSVLASLVQTGKTANDGMIVFGLYALVTTVASLYATRGELVRLRLVSERVRLDEELRATVGRRLRTLDLDLDRALEDVCAGGAGLESACGRLQAAVATARRAMTEIRVAACDLRGFRPAAPIPIGSPAVARLMLVGVFVCDGAMQVVGDLGLYGRSWRTLLAVSVILVGGTVLLAARPTRPTRPTGRRLAAYALIMGSAALPGGYFVFDLQGLANLWTFLLGFLLFRMRPPLSWAVVGLVFGAYWSLSYYPPPVPSLDVQIGNLVSFLILTWLTYSLVRLSELVEVLHRAREDLAAEAVARERVRVARELHDRLSFAISAIALKGELCQRMLSSDPQGALGHLNSLPVLARAAKVELESLTGVPVGLRFDRELAAACELLAAAGVNAVVGIGDEGLPPRVDQSMAVVLREMVTNVVKHSRATTCSITVTRVVGEGVVRLCVVNDGAALGAEASGPVGRSGSGLDGIAERTGGRLTAGRRPGGGFEAVAEFVVGSAVGPPRSAAQTAPAATALNGAVSWSGSGVSPRRGTGRVRPRGLRWRRVRYRRRGPR